MNCELMTEFVNLPISEPLIAEMRRHIRKMKVEVCCLSGAFMALFLHIYPAWLPEDAG